MSKTNSVHSLGQTADPAPTANAAPPHPTDAAGHLLGERLGVGGMGEVYRLADQALQRDLAIKVLKDPLLGSAEAEERFLREARLTGSLQHPGIVPVHQLGRFADGRPYYTMKLVRGRTFASMIRDEPQGPERLPRLLAIVEKVCQAVAYAHSKGVMHRDLKPGNVMVGEFGEVQVMDWGLAKELSRSESAVLAEATEDVETVARVEEGEGLSRAGFVLGTPAYMPPEQAAGDWEIVDERADVFALGAIFCELLTGRPPYYGANREELLRRARRGGSAEALERLQNCGADAALVDLCRECLAAERLHRPRHAGVVAERLESYQAEVCERLRKAELERAAAQARTAAERRARRLAAGLVAAALLLVAGGTGVVWRADRQRSDRRQVAAAALDKAEEALRGGRMGEVDTLLARSAERIAEGGLEELRARQDELTKSRAVVLELDDLLERAHTREMAPQAITTAYLEIFRRYGVQAEDMEPEAAADAIRGSPVRDRLVDGLDEWLAQDERDRGHWLRQVLTDIDPDPDRTTIRKSLGSELNVQGGDFLGIGGFIKTDQLNISPGLAGALTTRFAWGGNQPGIQRDSAPLRILRAAWAKRPDRYDLNFRLAWWSSSCRPPLLNESAGYYRAALALRPGSAPAWTGLGSTLRKKNDLDGSAACHRRSLELDPGRQVAYREFAYTLFAQKKFAEALALLERALRQHPDWAWGIRYDAACCAVLAGTAGGLKPFPQKEWSALRRKAFRWLQAELEIYRSIKEGVHIASFMTHWLTDPDLAPVREPGELAKLPADEQRKWEELWGSVKDLRDSWQRSRGRKESKTLKAKPEARSLPPAKATGR